MRTLGLLFLVLLPFLGAAAPSLPSNNGGKFVIPSHQKQIPKSFQHIEYNFGQTEIVLSGKDKLSGYLSIPINENEAFIQLSYPQGQISHRLHSQNISFYSQKSNVIFRWTLEENVFDGHSLPNSYCAYEIEKITPECGFWGQRGDRNIARLTFTKNGNVSFGIHALNFTVPQVFDHYVYTFVPFFISWNHPDVNFTLTLSEETKLAFDVQQYGYETSTLPISTTKQPSTRNATTESPSKFVTLRNTETSSFGKNLDSAFNWDSENVTTSFDGRRRDAGKGIFWRITKP